MLTSILVKTPQMRGSQFGEYTFDYQQLLIISKSKSNVKNFIYTHITFKNANTGLIRLKIYRMMGKFLLGLCNNVTPICYSYIYFYLKIGSFCL